MFAFALFSSRQTHFEHVTAHAKLVAQTEREMRQALHHPVNRGLFTSDVAFSGIDMYIAPFKGERRVSDRMAREMATAAAHVAFQYLDVERG